MRDRIVQPCHTFQAQRQPVAFHRDSIPAAYRTVAQRRFCVVSAVTLAARSRRRPATARPTAAAPEEHSKKTLHYSYRRLKSFGEHHCKLNRPCGRRTRVIHNPGVLCTVIHTTTIIGVRRFPEKLPENRQTKRKARRAGLPCKNLKGRISAQQHRRNGKSIQCPFNVTTYLGHTHLVGLCSSVVLVLRNYARHCGKCKPKRDDVPYLSQLLLSDRKNRKNAPCCANRNACLFIHVHLPRKNGVSEAYFTNSANEC